MLKTTRIMHAIVDRTTKRPVMMFCTASEAAQFFDTHTFPRGTVVSLEKVVVTVELATDFAGDPATITTEAHP